ncbi:MAG: hypothetical protein ACYDDF_05295 [Thermoplasmatota archaeon]
MKTASVSLIALAGLAAVLLLAGHANATAPFAVPCSTNSPMTLRTGVGTSNSLDQQGRLDYVTITVPAADCANYLGLTGLVNQGETLTTGGAAWTITYQNQVNLQTTAPTDIRLYLASDSATMGWSACAGSGSGATTPTAGDYAWSLDLGAPSPGATFTAHMTLDGTATGQPIFGTYRFVLYVESKQNANIDLYSDTSDGTIECSQTGFANVCDNADAFTQCPEAVFVSGTAITSLTTTNGAGAQNPYAYPDTLQATVGFNQTDPTISGRDQLTGSTGDYFASAECPDGTPVNFVGGSGGNWGETDVGNSVTMSASIGTNWPQTTTACEETGDFASTTGAVGSVPCDAWQLYFVRGAAGTGFPCAYFTGITVAGGELEGVTAGRASAFAIGNAFNVNGAVAMSNDGTHANGLVHIANEPPSARVNRGFAIQADYWVLNARGEKVNCGSSGDQIRAQTQTDQSVTYPDQQVTAYAPPNSAGHYTEPTYTIKASDPALWDTTGRGYYWQHTPTCLTGQNNQFNPTATSAKPILSVSFKLTYDAITHYLDGVTPQANATSFIIGSDLLDSRSHVTDTNSLADAGVTAFVTLESPSGTTVASATGQTQADSWAPHGAAGAPMVFTPGPPAGVGWVLNGSATDGLGNQGWDQVTVTFVAPLQTTQFHFFNVTVNLTAAGKAPSALHFYLRSIKVTKPSFLPSPSDPDQTPKWQIIGYNLTTHRAYNATPVGLAGLTRQRDTFVLNWSAPANLTTDRFSIHVQANFTGLPAFDSQPVIVVSSVGANTCGANVAALFTCLNSGSLSAQSLSVTTSADPYVPLLVWGGLFLLMAYFASWPPAVGALLALLDSELPNPVLGFMGRILLFVALLLMQNLLTGRLLPAPFQRALRRRREGDDIP